MNLMLRISVSLITLCKKSRESKIKSLPATTSISKSKVSTIDLNKKSIRVAVLRLPTEIAVSMIESRKEMNPNSHSSSNSSAGRPFQSASRISLPLIKSARSTTLLLSVLRISLKKERTSAKSFRMKRRRFNRVLLSSLRRTSVNNQTTINCNTDSTIFSKRQVFQSVVSQSCKTSSNF